MSQRSLLCWFDLPALDIDRAIKFYANVLAIKLKKETSEGMALAVFPHSDTAIGGCLFAVRDEKPSDHGMLPYFSVEGRLDDAIKVAAAQGGKVLQAKHAIGPHGYRAILLDSEGNRIALHSS